MKIEFLKKIWTQSFYVVIVIKTFEGLWWVQTLLHFSYTY